MLGSNQLQSLQYRQLSYETDCVSDIFSSLTLRVCWRLGGGRQQDYL